jgi:TonB-linked SusC/RagA family outer membrane protein
MKHIIAFLFVLPGFCHVTWAQSTESDRTEPDSVKLTTVAYGQQAEWETTASVSSVKGESLTKSFAANVANTLYGRIPGLTVQQGSMEPGNDAPALNIRGINTFSEGSDIFVVIDGIPSTYQSFQQLTSREIESITVLKDASATAIYGSRGANGVLLITTKQGGISPLKLNVNLQYGFNQATRLPNFLDAYNYALLYNEAAKNNGETKPRYSQADLNAYKNGTDPILYPNVNWYDELLQPASPMANYSLEARGGTEIVRYFVDLNVLSNRSLLKDVEDVSAYGENSSYQRYNFRSNFEVDFNSWLSGKVFVGGSVEDQTISGVNDGEEANISSLFKLLAAIPPNAFAVEVAPGKYGGSSMYRNPYAEIMERGFVSSNARSAQVATEVNADLSAFVKGLSVGGKLGFDTYFKSSSNKLRDYERYVVSRNAQGELVYDAVYGENTSLTAEEKASGQTRVFAIQSFIKYDNTFGLHGLNGLLMSNYDEYTAWDITLPHRNAGLGGRLTYSYDKKYIAEFSFGYSGDDNFPRGKRFGFFPAGSIGWVVSNEGFLKKNQTVNFLKLRASYGLTGNNRIGGSRYMYNQYYDWKGYYHLGTANSTNNVFLQGVLANPNVTWEKEKKLNVGLEATILRRLDVCLDYFNNNRYDILVTPYASVPAYLGLTLPSINDGKAKNSGFEATLRYKSNPKKAFNYFAEASVWFARNEIVYNAEAPQLYAHQYKAGYRIDQPFVLEANGLYQPSDFNADGTLKNGLPVSMFDNVQAGDIRYKNQTGTDDNVIDANDFIPLGFTNMPELTLGLRTGATYRGFDIEALFHGAANRTVLWSGKYFHAFQDNGKVSSIALDRWTPETAATATYPRLSLDGNQNNYQESTFWQKNGSFLKLRSLELGYALPQALVSKANITDIRLFVNGTNLFSLDYMDGFTDPETLTGYPAIRTWSVGINVQF